MRRSVRSVILLLLLTAHECLSCATCGGNAQPDADAQNLYGDFEGVRMRVCVYGVRVCVQVCRVRCEESWTCVSGSQLMFFRCSVFFVAIVATASSGSRNMETAYDLSSTLLRDRLKVEDRKILDAVKNDDIVVVSGDYDHIHLVLSAMNVSSCFYLTVL